MIGAAGITNNYVALTPGPIGEPRLPPSAVLPVVQTSSVAIRLTCSYSRSGRVSAPIWTR